MENNQPFVHFMIAGTNSGSGKTTVTLGLLRSLHKQGYKVKPFKCGPDYIDPIFHRQALNNQVYSGNLDCYFNTLSEYAGACQDYDIAVVEGVMGLFDGVGTGLEGSAAQVALKLNLPVLLTVNAKGLAGSIAPLVKGFVNWHPGVRIVGVIANNVGSKRHAELLQEALKQADLPPLLGYLPHNEKWQIPERHLGLALDKLEDGWFEALSCEVEANFDLDDLRTRCSTQLPQLRQPEANGVKSTLRLGVAYDEAFCFYYQENLALLRRYGVELVFFSPLNSSHLPPDLDGLYFGGGYPELFKDALEGNRALRLEIQNFAANGGSVYGECGGYLYLLDSFETPSGETVAGLGLLPGRAVMQKKLAALGYREVEGAWGRLRGHEFHYSRLVAEPEGEKLWRYTDRHGRSGECGAIRQRVKGSYIHLHFSSNPAALEKYIEELKR